LFKKLSISILCVLAISELFGQGWVNNGAKVVLTDSVHVVVTTANGHYMNKNGGLIFSKRKSYFTLRGNWYNNGGNVAIATNDGTVILDGGGQLIGGLSSTSFNSLFFQGNGNKTLAIPTLVGGGQLGLKSGVLKLNDKSLYLNSNTLTVNNALPSAIQRTQGLIIGETEPGMGYSFVQWNCRDQAINTKYSIPFGSIDQIYIPFDINIDGKGVSTRDSGFVRIAMFPTNPLLAVNNRPFPTGVNNLKNEFGLENDIKCLDRFYIVESAGYGFRPQLTFTYPYIDREWDKLLGSANDVIERELRAVRYNTGSSSWQYPGGGRTDVAKNNLSFSAGSNYTGQWVLFNWPSCPDVQFSTETVCDGESMLMANQSTVSKGVIDSVVWDVGGVIYTDLDTITHVFPNSGDFNVKLKVRSNRGCWDSAINVVTVHPLPLVDFSYNDTCLGQRTIFNQKSSTSTGALTSHFWDLKGVSTGVGDVFNHTFPSVISTDMVLTSFNTWGCRDSTTKTIQIRELPPVDYESNEICEGDVAFFYDRTMGTANKTNWTWKVDETTFSFNADSKRSFASNGVYSVKLIVENEFGCIDSITKNQLVKPKAAADFTFFPTQIAISDPLVRFFNSSGNANYFSWDFGDNIGYSNLANPEYEYGDTGVYPVVLIANNDGQCPDTVMKVLFVGPDIRIFIPNAFTPHGEDHINETFKPVGILHGLDEFYMEIYNRWGELLYKTDDINRPWDGTFRGSDVEQDNYLYLIKVVDVFRNEKWFKGIVTVLR